MTLEQWINYQKHWFCALLRAYDIPLVVHVGNAWIDPASSLYMRICSPAEGNHLGMVRFSTLFLLTFLSCNWPQAFPFLLKSHSKLSSSFPLSSSSSNCLRKKLSLPLFLSVPLKSKKINHDYDWFLWIVKVTSRKTLDRQQSLNGLTSVFLS